MVNKWLEKCLPKIVNKKKPWRNPKVKDFTKGWDVTEMFYKEMAVNKPQAMFIIMALT